ncbi:MAG: acetate--CoA ligase [Alphaproteobacteria bacterium]|nr:acetate--CoA ligase [Alphaproteobacteria bacterium]
MSHSYPVSSLFSKDAWINKDRYKDLYDQSMADPDKFWGEQGQRIDWIQPYATVKNTRFSPNVSIRWFEDGTLNVCANCVDRHLPTQADKTAILWQGDQPGQKRAISYRELYEEVCRFANVLKKYGVKKGDTVSIYMPMIPEAAFAMLACARLGAVHNVVFAGFSPEALASRIQDCGSKIVITADEGYRGGKTIPLKMNLDQSLVSCPTVEHVLVVERTGGDIDWKEGRDIRYGEAAASVESDCPYEEVGAEDPLFILHTSGSTGKPKGVVHTSGGYLVYAALTHQHIFDYHDHDIYWCTADVGWITGHSYGLYGPLANGATTVMFEGIPTHPDSARFWQVIDDFKVSIFYTAPTVIRSLMRSGDEPLHQSSRKSLRVLGSVGEPINPEAWEWYYHKIGESQCPIVDTWWQTETGGIMITPLPGANALKPGCATRPFFGVKLALVDNDGVILDAPEATGNLCIADSWPGQARTLHGNQKRFEETYFSTFKGLYFTGDGARRDADGDYWITGRVDDVLNVSGHRIGTAEIEAAVTTNALIIETAVVGYPHEVKGEGIYVYAIPAENNSLSNEQLVKEIKAAIRHQIGALASPDFVQIVSGLPKTRSGKIMRRILRKIAVRQYGDIGDTSTLSDQSVVEAIIEGREKMCIVLEDKRRKS